MGATARRPRVAPVLWAYYKRGVVLAQVVEVLEDGARMENCLSDVDKPKRFPVTGDEFVRWERVIPTKDDA